MSDCARVRDLMEDSVHARLGPEDSLLLASHLSRCQPCAALHDRVDRQRALVAAFAPRGAAPADLRALVLRKLTGAGRRAWLRPALGGALAASLLWIVALPLLLRLLLAPPSLAPFQVLVREAVNDHIRVVLRQRTGASGPSDPQALLALMAKVLDYPVPAPAPGEISFRLAGGRPSYLLEQTVACFYYQSMSAYASLFVLPLDRLGKAAAAFAEAPSVAEHGGYRMVYWKQRGYAYLLVSEAAAEQILPLATAIQRA